MRLTKILSLLIMIQFVVFITACEDDNPDLSITIHFDAQEGETVESVVYTLEDSNFILPTTTRAGYTFLGWTLDPNTEDVVSISDLISLDSSTITLYALWDLVEYELIVYPENGDASYEVIFVPGDNFSITIPSRVDYTFDGWYTDANYTTKFEASVFPDYDFELYAQWIEDEISYEDPNVIVIDVISQTDQTVIVQLSIEGEVSFIGYDMTFTYNETNLELTSYTNGTNNIINDDNSGVIYFNFVDAVNQTTDITVILTLEFDILNDDVFDLDLSVIDFIDITTDFNIIDTSYSIVYITE